MRHIIIGGEGFVGRQLATDLVALDEEVIVADIARNPQSNSQVRFVPLDVTDPTTFAAIALCQSDVVYNLAARMLSPILPKAQRRDFFWPVNYEGTRHILDWMLSRGSTKLVHFTTDMVYGHTQTTSVRETHPTQPLGEYGNSKLASESLCRDYRERGMYITVFRPRLIIGPGRLGILSKLFRLIDLNLPVPMIGAGKNAYQFVSVYDCATAARLAWQAGVPNHEYNLGSDHPPSVRELLKLLIVEAQSKSILLPTPAPLVKALLNLLDRVNLPLLDPEQYLIADENFVVDTSKVKQELGWSPEHRDAAMLIAAYREYRRGGGIDRIADAAKATSQ